MKINYKGYVILQSDYNNHVSIYKDGKMIFHSHISEKLNEDNLKQLVEIMIKLKKDIKEVTNE